MNRKLLEQLALAKEAGTKAMAKDFFAPTPGADEGSPQEEAAETPGQESAEGGGDLTPEQLEELMRMLGEQSDTVQQ